MYTVHSMHFVHLYFSFVYLQYTIRICTVHTVHDLYMYGMYIYARSTWRGETFEDFHHDFRPESGLDSLACAMFVGHRLQHGRKECIR